MSWEIVLLWLPVLACALIMFWCVRGMSRGRSSGAEQQGDGSRAGAEPMSAQDLREEVGALKARLALLEGKRARLEEEGAARAEPAGGGVDGSDPQARAGVDV